MNEWMNEKQNQQQSNGRQNNTRNYTDSLGLYSENASIFNGIRCSLSVLFNGNVVVCQDCSVRLFLSILGRWVYLIFMYICGFSLKNRLLLSHITYFIHFCRSLILDSMHRKMITMHKKCVSIYHTMQLDDDDDSCAR